MRAPIPRLWHMRPVGPKIGDIIPPGTSGDELSIEGARSPMFFREYLTEAFRATETRSPVSRLSCTFCFESREIAKCLAADAGKACFEVVPVDQTGCASRHDSNWITWIGEPGRSVANVVRGIDNYWDELPLNDRASIWEWLISCGLKIISEA
jgi:hypothetical protein